MRENKSTSHSYYLSAARDLPLANAKANASSVGSVLAAARTAISVRESLRASFKKEAIQQQQDHGADDRHDPTGHVIPPGKDAADPSAYKGAGYT